MKVAALLFILILSPAIVAAQDSDKVSGFAIRFQLNDSVSTFVPIRGSHGGVGFGVSPLQTKDHKYSTQVSMINLSAARRGDEWDLSVSVTLPTLEEKLLASRRVKVAERIIVERFSDYDILPSEVSIVRIDAPPSPTTEIINKTTSIQVEKVTANVLPYHYRLTFTNNSSKRVYGIEVISNNHTPRRSAGYLNSSCENPLLEPHAAIRRDVPSSVDRDYKLVRDSEYQVADVTASLEIATVIFTDGSYEGEPQYAAMRSAEAIGARHQIPRVLQLVEKALSSQEPGWEVVALLKEELRTLDVEVQSAEVEELRHRLAGLNERIVNDAGRSIGWGKNEVKVCVQRALVDRSATVPLNDWLSQQAERLKRWASMLP